MLVCASASLGTGSSRTQRLSPPIAAFLVLFLLVVRRQEGHRGQVLLLRADAPQQDEPVDLAVDAGAPALLDGDFDVPVVLDTETVSCRLQRRAGRFTRGVRTTSELSDVRPSVLETSSQRGGVRPWEQGWPSEEASSPGCGTHTGFLTTRQHSESRTARL